MLAIMRKGAKSWALRILLFAVASTFVLWGVGGFVSEDLSAVITVDGAKIPYSEYLRTRDRLIESYRTVMGGALDAKAIKDLKISESAVDYLLERALLARTASNLNMTVGPGEIRSFVEREPAFNDKGVFSRQRYLDFLSANSITSDSFEASLANDMTLAKVRSFLRASAVVSPQEIEEILDMSARKVEARVAKLDPDRFVRLVPAPAAAEISSYFEEHREEFRRPESFQAVFAVIDPASFKTRATVADDELAALYEE
jgi:peptidyl-prolyl cis-trans isomerase D